MAALVHVHRHNRASQLLQPLLSSGVRVIDASPDDGAPKLAQESAADAAVIATDVEAPVRIAREIHRAAPDAHIVFITDELTEPALRRELLLAPRIGTHWSVARSDAPGAVEETIRNALEATLHRRQTRTTIGRMNLRLIEKPPAPRPVVSDHFLAAVLHQLSDGVVMIDRRGMVVAANDAARAIFGPTLLRGAPFESSLPEGGEELASRITAAEDDTTLELSIPHGDRQTIVEVRLTKVKNERSAVVGTAILARDVTDRRNHDARERVVADATMALSSTLDLDLAMQRLADRVAGNLHGVVVVDIVEGDTVVRRAIAGTTRDVAEVLQRYAPKREEHPGIRAFRTGAPFVRNHVDEQALRSISTDDKHFELMRSIGVRAVAAVPIAAGRQLIGSLAVARATPFSEAEIALLRAIGEATANTVQNIWLYHAAEQANRAKEEFLATLSHELRTPMTSVLGWIQLMRAGGLDEATEREALDAMEQSARVQAQLIDDLLDLSRIQMGKLHLTMRTLDVAQVVRAAIETIRPAANAKGIAIGSTVDNDLMVSGDANRLQQVIWNLLSNSVKFTDRGGSVTVSVCRDGSKARIEVRDTGKGIERDFLPYVFDRFRQADSAATRRYGGLGLGLAIVRQIVELHGGTVNVASEGLDRGATFTVCLPIPAVRMEPAPEPEQAKLPSLAGVDVLLVEDDAASAQMLTTLLRQAGAEVRAKPSVADALEALRERIPDVLVSDIAMPEEDGFALIRQIRSTLRISAERLPAIALSAFSDMRTRVDVLGAGFQRFLQKPVDTIVLANAVADIVKPFRA